MGKWDAYAVDAPTGDKWGQYEVKATPEPSIASQGLGYVGQHPFKTAFEPALKTATGKGIAERVDSAVGMTPFNIASRFGNNPIANATAIAQGTLIGTGAQLADMATTPFNMIGGALAKPIAKLGGEGMAAAKTFFNFDQKGLSLAGKVRNVAAQAKQANVDQFGANLEKLAQANPNKTVSLQDAISSIKENMTDMSPEAKSVFRKVPILRDMLKEPNAQGYVSPDSISLKQTQDIINYINTKVPRTIKANHLDILDAQSDIRAAQLEAFPEMAQARTEYGKFANDYNLVKRALRPGATVSAIKSNFANNVEVKDAASRVFTPEVLNAMRSYRGQIGTINALKILGISSLGLGAAHGITQKVMGK